MEKHNPEGLSQTQQQGLYGEFWFLRQVIIPQLGSRKGIQYSTGPRGTQQDFQFPNCAVEVKTTVEKQHQKLTISSERQLDDTGTGTLILLHLSLDVRQGRGESLPEIVNSVRTLVQNDHDPFHIQIEEFSRTIWAPAVDGTQRQTRWFYERARGQYLDAKGREGTAAKKKIFTTTHPTSQKFTKTDLAKFENTWNQLPHLVSLGAEKNFREFTIQLAKRGKFQPDEDYFKRLIAKAILFRKTEKIVQAQQFGGYRANIVTYTLAYLSYKTAQRIDLERIWREQGLSPALQEAIKIVSHQIHQVIINPPGGRNVTEWCKKEECWKQIQTIDIELPNEFCNELISVDTKPNQIDKGIESPDAEDLKVIAEISEVPDETWFQLAHWAKETDNLHSWQRSLAFSLGKLAAKRKSPSYKQANQGIKILQEAEQLGFKYTHESNGKISV